MACKDYALQTGVKFGASNTLLLESDEEQCFHDWRNSLVIDRFTREDIWPSISNFEDHRDQIKILRDIRDDIFTILDTSKGDIRTYLRDQC